MENMFMDNLIWIKASSEDLKPVIINYYLIFILTLNIFYYEKFKILSDEANGAFVCIGFNFTWISSSVPGLAVGGIISAYDLEGKLVEVVASNLSFPSAITFDKKGNLWLLENNNIALPDRKPTVRVLN